MSKRSIQDVLPLVQMPSRYLGSEVNRVRKAWQETRLHVALAFPDLYEIGTSHFGLQILYNILNAREDILAERVFAPAVDMDAHLRRNNIPLVSLESHTPLNQFDIIGFSLLYELNYTNMVNMLDLAGVPLLSAERVTGDPIVIAGGPCTCNPEPVADFFDAIVVGDGEHVIVEMSAAWLAWSRHDLARRDQLLRRWAAIKGVYIPAHFRVSYGHDGKPVLKPRYAAHGKIEKALVADLESVGSTTKPILPFGRPVHDRLRMEIARGCTRGCRFCQAGMIYRPVRERQPEAIVRSAARLLTETGYEDLSLLSLSTGDYGCIAPLISQIMGFGEKDHVAVSLPSLRAGSITPELMEMIRKVRKTGFTIAPEAGSQRLRNVINKNITEADIVGTVESAFSLGWRLIKLYFMIGLPTETQADLAAIVNLVKRLTALTASGGKPGRINVSIATFVPKPHTPFQWEPQIGLDAALEKMNWLKDNLKGKGVQVKWQDPRVSRIEGVWSRGDRRLCQVLINAWKSGCRFDGWSDYFDYDRWVAVFKKSGIDPEDYTAGSRDTDMSLPWNHIDFGVKRSFLIQERENALKGRITEDCRNGSCSNCGVCDFKKVQPITFSSMAPLPAAGADAAVDPVDQKSVNYRIRFTKGAQARFLGHLEMVKVFIRALRRAQIPLKYSHGFHPMPKINFADTLPMGMQSQDEQMGLVLTESIDPAELMRRLQEELPDGLDVTGAWRDGGKNVGKHQTYHHYRVDLVDGLFRDSDFQWFLEQQCATIERRNKKGKRVVIDLKKAVIDLTRVSSKQMFMTLGTDNRMTIRPSVVMKAVFGLTDRQIQTATITKRKTEHV